MAAPLSFDDYVSTLTRLTVMAEDVDDEGRRPFEEAAAALRDIPVVDRATLALLIARNPDLVPILGSVCGLSQEGLRRSLQYGIGTAGWIKAAQERPEELIGYLDDEFGLVGRVEAERNRDWSYADVLLERSGARRSAGRAIGRGRSLEDDVEAVIKDLRLPYELRGRFVGARGVTAPADLAVPTMADAGIVTAMKGFDSTGSKLTDAVTEVDSMAKARRPDQFIFAVVDGIGWLGRKGDLRRLWQLWDSGAISGLYARCSLPAYALAVEQAAKILKLL